MSSYQGKAASDIRWHMVPDLDLLHLMDGYDQALADAAREERERRYGAPASKGGRDRGEKAQPTMDAGESWF